MQHRTGNHATQMRTGIWDSPKARHPHVYSGIRPTTLCAASMAAILRARDFDTITGHISPRVASKWSGWLSHPALGESVPVCLEDVRVNQNRISGLKTS